MSRSIRSGSSCCCPCSWASPDAWSGRTTSGQGLRVTELRGDRGPASQRRIDQLPGLVEGLQRSVLDRLIARPTVTTSRSSRPGCGSCKPAPSWASRSARSSRSPSRPSGPFSTTARATDPPPPPPRRSTRWRQLLATGSPDRGAGELGARLLGTDPARDPIGRRQPARDPRGLRQHPRHPDRGRGQHLHRAPDRRGAHPHRPGEHRHPAADPADRRGPVHVRHRDPARRRAGPDRAPEHPGDAADPRDAATPGEGCSQRAARHAPNDLGDLLDGPSAIPVSPPQIIVASRPICCAAGRTSGAPSCRRLRSRPRSEWTGRLPPATCP